jgi:hypothetical protein
LAGTATASRLAANIKGSEARINKHPHYEFLVDVPRFAPLRKRHCAGGWR